MKKNTRSYPCIFTQKDLAELGLSQKEISQKLGITYNYFNQIINGYVNFNETEYKQFCDIIDVAKKIIIEKYNVK